MISEVFCHHMCFRIVNILYHGKIWEERNHLWYQRLNSVFEVSKDPKLVRIRPTNDLFELLQEMDWQGSVLSHFIATECEDLAHYSSSSPTNIWYTLHSSRDFRNCTLFWDAPKFFSSSKMAVLTFTIFLLGKALKFLGIFYSFFEDDKWTSDMWNLWDNISLSDCL